jgi:hypothetical protein
MEGNEKALIKFSQRFPKVGDFQNGVSRACFNKLNPENKKPIHQRLIKVILFSLQIYLHT